MKSALLLGAGIAIGAGAIHGLHAATGAPVYTVYEANITDEASYTKALPEVEKYIKENGGTRVGGGFNKTKLISGSPAVGNRYVLVRWKNEGAFTKEWTLASKHGSTKTEMVPGRSWCRAWKLSNLFSSCITGRSDLAPIVSSGAAIFTRFSPRCKCTA